MTRTGLAAWPPTLRTSITNVSGAPPTTGFGDATFEIVRSAVGGVLPPGVGVPVGVNVGVGEGGVVVLVDAVTNVLAGPVLLASFDSATTLAGSTVAVSFTVASTDVVTKPVTVIVAIALGPVPKEPRSQSSSPPITLPSREQTPRVVLKPVYVKLAGG